MDWGVWEVLAMTTFAYWVGVFGGYLAGTAVERERRR